MKPLFTVLLLIFFSTGYTSAQRRATADKVATTSSNGKDFMINYYQQTYDALKKSVEGLSAAQLQFKPAADKWSISQCLDHIVMTEKALFDYAKQGMDKPANPERRKEVKTTDEQLIAGMNERTGNAKAKAPDNLVGKGTYTQAAAALGDLQQERKPILAYVNQVSVDDFRNHISDSPFGPVDAYHTFLYIPAHTSRHTAQIEEVKANPNFPK